MLNRIQKMPHWGSAAVLAFFYFFVIALNIKLVLAEMLKPEKLSRNKNARVSQDTFLNVWAFSKCISPFVFLCERQDLLLMDRDVSISSGPSWQIIHPGTIWWCPQSLRRLKEKMGHPTDSSLNERPIGGLRQPGVEQFHCQDGWKINVLSGMGGRRSRGILWD